MSEPAKVADAFFCSRDFPVGRTDRDFARNALFGPALGSERVHSREIHLMPGSMSLVTRISATDVDNTLFQFPKNDPRHPDTCHDWFVAKKIDAAPGFVPDRKAIPKDFAGDTVLIGFKKGDPNASSSQ